MGLCITCKNAPFEFDMGYGTFYRFRNKIANFVPDNPNDSTKKFLELPDCEGKLSYKECKELFEDITDLEDNEKYGYSWNQHTMNDFKCLLCYCYSKRCNLVWY